MEIEHLKQEEKPCDDCLNISRPVLVSQLSFCITSAHQVLWLPGKVYLLGLQPALRLLGWSNIKSFSLRVWQAVRGMGLLSLGLTSHLVVYSSNPPVFLHRLKETFCCVTGFDQRLKLVSCEIRWSPLKRGLFAKHCCMSSRDHKKHC